MTQIVKVMAVVLIAVVTLASCSKEEEMIPTEEIIMKGKGDQSRDQSSQGAGGG